MKVRPDSSTRENPSHRCHCKFTPAFLGECKPNGEERVNLSRSLKFQDPSFIRYQALQPGLSSYSQRTRPFVNIRAALLKMLDIWLYQDDAYNKNNIVLLSKLGKRPWILKSSGASVLWAYCAATEVYHGDPKRQYSAISEGTFNDTNGYQYHFESQSPLFSITKDHVWRRAVVDTLDSENVLEFHISRPFAFSYGNDNLLSEHKGYKGGLVRRWHSFSAARRSSEWPSRPLRWVVLSKTGADDVRSHRYSRKLFTRGRRALLLYKI